MTDDDSMFGHESLFVRLENDGLHEWTAMLRAKTANALQPENNSDLLRWKTAISGLPKSQCNEVDLRCDAVTVRQAAENEPIDAINVERRLQEFHPWRKGPFDLLGIKIDTEWRSDLKWNRLHPHVDFRDKKILDVGSGNGYYGWRMLGAGATSVVGLDPFLLYVMQFAAVRRLVGDFANHVLPVGDEVLRMPTQYFDCVLSMGVLYHRRSPIDHLTDLRKSLRPGGEIILETLVIESETQKLLFPTDRYAKMRNVWFIPSVSMLETWLGRVGFRDITIADVTPTTTAEQRRTDWMTFESLDSFLDPHDATKTIEGYASPVRALAIARNPS